MFSCYKTDVVQYQTWNQDPATKVSGLQINMPYNDKIMEVAEKNFYLNMMKQCGQIQKIILVPFRI